MKKNELIEYLDIAIQQEEKAFPIYAEHLKTVLEWSGLTTSDKDQIVAFLEQIKIETSAHELTLRKVKEYVMKENKDVF